MNSAIEVRDLRFPLGAVPRDWHGRGAAVSAYFDQLSVFFPVGERFFVRSVKHFVAFDLFQAMGGTWFTRCRAMVIVSLFFWSLVVLQQLAFMSKRGILFSPREHWRLFRFCFVEPGALSSLVRPYLSYFRRDFHPAARGGFELVEAWKRAQPS